MTNLKSAHGFLAVFFVLALIGLFLMSNMSEEISTFYMTFMLISMVGMVSKSNLFGDYSKYSIFLVAPIIAHVMNNAVTVSTQMALPLLYPLVLTAGIAFVFYSLFKNDKRIKRFTLYGFLLGFALTAEYFTGTPLLGLKTLSVPLAIGDMSKVFLLGVMAGVVEEVFFRGVLFQFFRNVLKEQYVFSAVMALMGITFVYMSEIQLLGWAFIALAVFVMVSKRSLRKWGDWGAVGVVSAMFGLFHYTAYGGSPDLMTTAFIFSVMCFIVMMVSEKGKVI